MVIGIVSMMQTTIHLRQASVLYKNKKNAGGWILVIKYLIVKCEDFLDFKRQACLSLIIISILID